jgi:hypothetical protein
VGIGVGVGEGLDVGLADSDVARVDVATGDRCSRGNGLVRADKVSSSPLRLVGVQPASTKNKSTIGYKIYRRMQFLGYHEWAWALLFILSITAPALSVLTKLLSLS